ncbi:hypothetical protein EVAR_978_1 [Eumeta japonica]|uniref:Integrase catalytic domain-containing protein n=1 Tax=Eumeta variegata TaxID=151549 RepID=A0A4C1SGX3_EUMVA|nr:hypothetical protein EVAR_978_1 [Eumeta japonica]
MGISKYIFVIIDYFKRAEVFAILNQEAVTVAKKFVNEVFCRFGISLEIYTDQGKNFESQLFQESSMPESIAVGTAQRKKLCRFELLAHDAMRSVAYLDSVCRDAVKKNKV